MVLKKHIMLRGAGGRPSCWFGTMPLSTSELAVMLLMCHACSDNRFATLFLHPVREEDAPGYYEIIHKSVMKIGIYLFYYYSTI